MILEVHAMNSLTLVEERHVSINTSPDEASQSQLAIQENSQDASAGSITTCDKYVVVITAALVLFVGVGFTNAFGVFQEFYAETTLKNQRPERIIMIGSTAASLYLILGSLTGRFADLVGYRPSLLIGTGLIVGSMFVASVSTSYIQLLSSQGIMFGLGVAFVYLPAISISRQYWKQNYGLANGIVVSGGALGGTILPYVVRKLIIQEGLATTFRVLGYIAAAALTPSILLLRPAKPTQSLWRRRRDNEQWPLLDLSLLHNAKFNALVVACTVAMVGFLPRYFLVPESAIAQGIDTT